MGIISILGFHVTSQYFPNMDVRHICAPRSVKLYGVVSLICVVLAFFEQFYGCGMDLSPNIEEEKIKKLGSKIPMPSGYGTALKSQVELRYLQKISVVPCEH